MSISRQRGQARDYGTIRPRPTGRNGLRIKAGGDQRSCCFPGKHFGAYELRQ